MWKTNNEIIDLGLSVNWASINIGANAISDYGYIYAWGMTTETPEYSFSKGLELPVTECKNISGNKLYDPVARWIDKDWRMPTKDEMQELLDNCNWTESKQNGVDGYNLISKINGKSLFFPLSGYYFGSSYYSSTSVYSWTSSPGSSNEYADNLHIYSGNSSVIVSRRCHGQNVRAVVNKSELDETSYRRLLWNH